MKSKWGPLAILSLLTGSFCVGCSSPSSPTRIAVFADNQLTASNVGGAVENSALYLKNHLRFCKENKVDVIMISGDLVNNAVDSYYNRFESILKEVYGDDEKLYPEFVYSMGNHEWYTADSSENKEAKSIALFKKHARIESKNLKKRATFDVVGQTSSTGADFYKVVNGVPFVSISGSGPDGMLTYPEEAELRGWFEEISKLPSVKNGGPIFVSNHYAVKNLTYTFGQGAGSYSESIDALLKPYPTAILFTGDTHFSGVNERTINQIDYTSINIGSSTYSRHVSRSATMNRTETFYNMESGSGAKDKLIGEVATNYNKTPHIQIVDVDANGNTKINRYFTAIDPNDSKRIGLEWLIPSGLTKDKFEYTNARFANKVWANKLYGSDGLHWDEEARLTFDKDENGLTLHFQDVTDFNCVEHYRLTINESNRFDFVSHYYKYEDAPHEYSFQIKSSDLPSGDIASLKLEAYDFFDNPSINSLRAEI